MAADKIELDRSCMSNIYLYRELKKFLSEYIPILILILVFGYFD